jgi:uncharacterized membrane protein YphA (DoxX/SURF4 family)
LKAKTKDIYVEIHIRAAMDEVWRLSQQPDLHQRWDLRFTDIQYLPRPNESQPQRFLYATRLGFGLKIAGEGETVGHRSGPNGQYTSALKFWSSDPKSLIREGAGYWQYIPAQDYVRFITGYHYQTRFGVLGRSFDALIFRPLLGWATAWSFDRLRLWLEQGFAPEISLQRALIHAVSRLTIAFVWLYHGLVPKLIYQSADELAMLVDSGIPPDVASLALNLIGWGEVGLGLLFLLAWRVRRLFWFNIGVMLLATLGVAVNSPRFLMAAFNPITLNVLMLALSVSGYLSSANLPSARNCLRHKPEVK